MYKKGGTWVPGVFFAKLWVTLLSPFAENIFGRKNLADLEGTPPPFTEKIG